MRTKDYHFTDGMGRPFFWLADTAWNIALRAPEEEWREYLTLRAEQEFTVIQFVATQWRGCSKPWMGRPFDVTSDGGLVFNEGAWEALDRFVELTRAAGLVPAPVMLWANTPTCPGQSLSEAHAIEVGRRQVARWGGGPVFWLLGGDGVYDNEEGAERWRRIGRGIFHDCPEALVTMHPCGVNWPTPYFRNEPWFRFSGIQSGHGVDEKSLRFLVDGPPAKEWEGLGHPIVNLEPNYEMARAYGTDIILNDYHVRRASWWSVLCWPTVGVTYGNNAIWIWGSDADSRAEGHDAPWRSGPWREGLRTQGIEHLGVLRKFMEGIPWTRLRPGGEVLCEQPGENSPEAWIAVAAAPELLAAYLPVGGDIHLRADLLPGKRFAWFDPREGREVASGVIESEDRIKLEAPDEQDWVLRVDNG